MAVALTAPDPRTPQWPVQTTAEGTLLWSASAPSLGYESVYLSSQAATGGSVSA